MFVPISRDTVRCFRFKNNKIVSRGKLVIKIENGKRVAKRNGYWCICLEPKESCSYYFDDQPIDFNSGIPVKAEPMQ